MKKSKTLADVNRRNFLKGSSFATLMTMLGGVELRAQSSAPAEDNKPVRPKVKVGLIGLGLWGRDVLATLSRLKQAEIAAICDNYPAFVRRSAKNAPGATTTEDYRTILDNKDIAAVIIATPTHKHKDIVIAGLEGGKHVYCEAPIASTVEDAKAIAQAAAKAQPKQYFQGGLQLRSDPQRHFLLPFVRSGAIGKWVQVRSQWHKKTSWRQISSTPERDKAVNWRLAKDTSSGLAGEIALHQIDSTRWFLGMKPVSVTGFGALRHWTEDGRDVPDTIQFVVEFPGGVHYVQDTTLASSFDTEYEMFYGSDASIMLRGNKAWLFKEVDSPLLGWEVYARKDRFGDETGIALVANATKIAAQGDNPIEEAPFTNTPLYYSLENFLTNAGEVTASVEEFSAAFDPKDIQSLKKYLADIHLDPYAGYKEAFESTVIALKVNEAITKREKITFKKEWFDLA
jgi:predicted dehydrogenase